MTAQSKAKGYEFIFCEDTVATVTAKIMQESLIDARSIIKAVECEYYSAISDYTERNELDKALQYYIVDSMGTLTLMQNTTPEMV